jgi:cob(I)alamin adenosyltransferase
MKYKKMYTKGGDGGKTSLWSGERVDKFDPRIEAIGVFDELNAALGVAFANSITMGVAFTKSITIDFHKSLRDNTAKALTQIMGEMAYSKEIQTFDIIHLKSLEFIYDEISSHLDEEHGGIKGWAIYGENGIRSSFYDWATTIARRAEVQLWKLKNINIEISEECYIYMNLLSKVLFLMGRLQR